MTGKTADESRMHREMSVRSRIQILHSPEALRIKLKVLEEIAQRFREISGQKRWDGCHMDVEHLKFCQCWGVWAEERQPKNVGARPVFVILSDHRA